MKGADVLLARANTIEMAGRQVPGEILSRVVKTAAQRLGSLAANNKSKVSIKVTGNAIHITGRDAAQYRQMLTMLVSQQMPAAVQQIRAEIIAAAKS